MFSNGPIFFIARICSRKSSSVKLPLRIFSSMRLASSSSITSAAFSTRLTTSPIPRIRPAMRSGWNASNSSNFSPRPANLMGFPVTLFIDNAAPPRASPSSLVRMDPVMPSASSKCVATLTASCPVAASSTSKISCGLMIALRSTNSCTRFSSICKRPAVSKIKTLHACARAASSAAFAILRTSFSPFSASTGTSTCSPRTSNCSIAAGR